MKSRMFAKGSLWPERSARRNATVTNSVPLASSASRISSLEANLPVPTSRREVNSRSAILSFEGLSDIRLIYSAQSTCHPERSAAELTDPVAYLGKPVLQVAQRDPSAPLGMTFTRPDIS